MTKRFLSMAVGMALASAASYASTITLNGYSLSSECESIAGPVNSGCSASTGAGTGTVQFALDSATGPFLNAASSTNTIGLNTSGSLLYQILISGPGTTALVDVNYLLTVGGFYSSLGNDEDANLNTGADFNVGGFDIADAQIHVDAFGGSIENGFAPSLSDTSLNASFSPQTGSWGGTLSGPTTITLTTGVAYNVSLSVQADCLAQGSGVNCSTSAAIDPTFAIDPGQANASQYSILLSPDVGNGSTSTVPEPGSFVLLGTALIGVGLRSRRSRTAR